MKNESIILRMRDLINYMGLTEYSFSQLTSIDRSNLSKMINGQRTIGGSVINKIVLATNCNKEWLQNGIGTMFDSKNNDIIPDALCHYTNVDSLLSILSSGKLNFSNKINANDIYERKILGFRRMEFGNVLEVKKEVDNTKFISFSSTAKDSIMWDAYAKNHEGACIEFDKDSILYKNPILNNRVFNVKYDLSSINKNMPTEYLLKFKGKSWSYEKEIRFICNTEDESVDISGCINKIYLGSELKASDIQKIAKAFCDKEIDDKLEFIQYIYNYGDNKYMEASFFVKDLLGAMYEIDQKFAQKYAEGHGGGGNLKYAMLEFRSKLKKEEDFLSENKKYAINNTELLAEIENLKKEFSEIQAKYIKVLEERSDLKNQIEGLKKGQSSEQEAPSHSISKR